MAEKYIFGGGGSMAQSFGRQADAERAYRNDAPPNLATCRRRGICIKPKWTKKGSGRRRSGKNRRFWGKKRHFRADFRVSMALGGQNKRKMGCFRHLGAFGRLSEYRSHTTSPDGDVGGSNNIESTAVWSRDDLVPVGFSGLNMLYSTSYMSRRASEVPSAWLRSVCLSLTSSAFRMASWIV